MRLNEIEKRLDAIKGEINNDNSDLDALNKEVDQLVQERKNILNRAEQRKTMQERVANMTDVNVIESWSPDGSHTATIGSKESRSNDVFATPEYRSAFYKNILGKKLSSTEQRAMHKANEVIYTEKRLDNFNTVTDNAAVIPTHTLNEVVRKARKAGGVIDLARGFNVPANLKVPVGTPLTDAEWHVEGEKVDAEKANPASVEFKNNEIIKIFSLSAGAKKMSIDAFESYIVDELVTSVMSTVANSLVNGEDVPGQGSGLASVQFTEAKNNLVEYAAGAKPEYTDFVETISKLKRGYANGSVFVVNNATLYTHIYNVQDNNKRPIFILDAQEDQVGKILGYPVIVDDYMADGEVYFGNPNYLGYNLPDGIALEVSTQSSFHRGLVDYRALAIADTKVIVEEAFVKLTEASA